VSVPFARFENRYARFLTTPFKEFAQRLFSAKSTRVNITDLLNRERVFRFVRFATVGSSVAVVDFGGVAIASRFLPPLLAVTVAYFIAVCCHFLLNKYWVFRCRRNDYAKQLVQYGGVILTNWLITIGVVHFSLSTFTTNVLIAKLCAIPCATMCNFLLMQLVVFRAHRAEENAADLSYSSSMAEMD
jgi:putative flippase GtrA